MKRTMKLTASLSLLFGAILAVGFLSAQVAPQPQNPVFAGPQAGQGGFQIPGRAKMAVLTAPANNTTGLISDPTGTCAAQNYANFYWNPFTRDLVGCVPNSGLASGSSLANAMNYAVLFGARGFNSGIGPAIASAGTIAPTFSIFHVTGTTPLVTLTTPTGISSGARMTVIFDGIDTWTAAGNIAVLGTNTTAASFVDFVWDAATSKWYPSRVA